MYQAYWGGGGHTENDGRDTHKYGINETVGRVRQSVTRGGGRKVRCTCSKTSKGPSCEINEKRIAININFGLEKKKNEKERRDECISLSHEKGEDRERQINS